MAERDEKTSGVPSGRVDAQIEAHLKRIYDDALREAVPERLLDLLAELRSKDGPK